MTQEERIQYLSMAMKVAGFQCNEKAADMFLHMLELIDRKKGESDLNSMVTIKCRIDEKYKLLEESRA